MKRSSSSGQATPQAVHAGGQAALILIMIMAVVGTVSVGVASRSVENLRSSEIESTSTQSFLAAESALELALQTKADVQDPDGKYSAVVSSAGTDGFVADAVEAGDVVQVSLVGSAGVTGMNIYWDNDAAIKVEVLNSGGPDYSVKYYTADQDGVRRGLNKFSIPSGGSSSFKGITFGNRLTINPFNPPAGQATVMVRIIPLYQESAIGVEPVGGTLASQTLTVNAVGIAQNNVTTNLIFSKFSDRVPAVFDNVLFTRGSLSQ